MDSTKRSDMHQLKVIKGITKVEGLSASEFEASITQIYPWELLLIDLGDSLHREEKGKIFSSYELPFPYIPQEETEEDQFSEFRRLLELFVDWNKISLNVEYKIIAVYGETEPLSIFFLHWLQIAIDKYGQSANLRAKFIYLKDTSDVFSKEVPLLWELGTDEQLDMPTMITPHLYLGSFNNASSLETLQKLKIAKIVNMTIECENKFPSLFQYHNVAIWDVPEASLLPHFETLIGFIELAEKNNEVVLVHCRAGISRSATVVIAYLMKRYGWNLKKAFIFAKLKRSILFPNFGFFQQLLELEKQLFAVNSIVIDELFENEYPKYFE